MISDPRRWRRARSWFDCVSTRCTHGACRSSSPWWRRFWTTCRKAQPTASWGRASARTNAGSTVSFALRNFDCSQNFFNCAILVEYANFTAINLPHFKLPARLLANPIHPHIAIILFPFYLLLFATFAPPKNIRARRLRQQQSAQIPRRRSFNVCFSFLIVTPRETRVEPSKS